MSSQKRFDQGFYLPFIITQSLACCFFGGTWREVYRVLYVVDVCIVGTTEYVPYRFHMPWYLLETESFVNAQRLFFF